MNVDTLGTVTNIVTDSRVVYVDPQIQVRNILAKTLDSPELRTRLLESGRLNRTSQGLKEWALERKVRM